MMADKHADIIDSRDIIERIEELENDLQAVFEQELEEGAHNLDFEEWLNSVRADSSSAHCHSCFDDAKELQELRQLSAVGENSPDWRYGEQLISRDYFVQYTEELIKDCYELPKEFNSGEWPWRHMQIDFESAAEELEQDYFSVYYFGHEFLIRG